jgi:hypothetical protein
MRVKDFRWTLERVGSFRSPRKVSKGVYYVNDTKPENIVLNWVGSGPGGLGRLDPLLLPSR